MKIDIIKKVTEDIKYLKATMGVRYWNDCSYSTDNGKTWIKAEEDTEEESNKFMNAIPFVKRQDIGYRESDYWDIIIDIDEGKVLNWSKDFCISTWFKVCDDGEYVFLDKDMNEVVNITKEYKEYYVPNFLSLEDEGYGDYVYIDINGQGNIKNADLMRSRISSFFKENNENN